MISVIIPTYNRDKTLYEAILSVVNQTYKNYEIIVVNDGGEGTEDVIKSIRLKNPFINIQYIKHKKNLGPSAARNTGIKIANGDYIAFLDDDDIFYSNHLEVLINAIKSNKNFSIAYTGSKVVEIDEKGNKIEKSVYNFPFSKEKLLIENFIPINSILIKKEIFIKENFWFNEKLKYLEDYDLWIRLSQKYNFLHIPKITSEIRTFKNSLSFNKVEMFKNQIEIYKKFPVNKKTFPKIYIQRKKIIDELKGAIYLINKKKNKKSLKKVSIIIPLFEVHKINNLLQAIEKNTLYFEKEIIFVGNISKNVDTFNNKLKVISSNSSKLTTLINCGAKHSTGGYLFFLINSIPFPYWIISTVKLFEKIKNCSLIGGKTLTYKEFYFNHETLKNFSKIFNINERFSINANIHKKVDLIFTNIISIKRQDFFNVNMFNENLNFLDAIIDLCLKLKRSEKTLYYNPFSEVLLNV